MSGSTHIFSILANKLGAMNGWQPQDAEKLASIVKMISVIGFQAGDEGKGGISAELAHREKACGNHVYICSGSGGANAGHTFYHNGYKYNTNILPASFMGGELTFMGSNKLYNLNSFKKEVTRICSQNGDVPALLTQSELAEKLIIDNQGKITFIPALLEERINECVKRSSHGGSVGTTGQGISTTIAQYDVKCPIEIVTALNAYKDNKMQDYLENYYKICDLEAIHHRYCQLLEAGRISDTLIDSVMFERDYNAFVKTIITHDMQNLNWFCSLFQNSIKNHKYFNHFVLQLVKNDTPSTIILEGVQANSLAAVNGPLNSTTSSELNPDVLMYTSFAFCDFTSFAMAGGKVENINVIKLIQSTVGNHYNPAKIVDYADLLKFEYTNSNDPDGNVAKLLSQYPQFGKYAKLACLTMESSKCTPSFLLKDGVLDESTLLSHYLGEKGTTTGRVRELSWPDFIRMCSCSFNQVCPKIALARLDAYNMFTKFRVCYGYKINGTTYLYHSSDEKDCFVFTSYKDFTDEEMHSAEPLYKEFDSWAGTVDLTQCKSMTDFPKEAQDYIKTLANEFGDVVAVNLSASSTLLL